MIILNYFNISEFLHITSKSTFIQLLDNFLLLICYNFRMEKFVIREKNCGITAF